MKHLLIAVCVFALTLFFPVEAFALEGISHFNSDIVVQRDTSVDITETIQYYTTVSKHGVYRYIPTRYTRNGLNYTADVTDIRIEDEHGDSINYERSWENGNVVLKIGDADITFIGPKTYIISYKVSNAIQLPPELPTKDGRLVPKPELYWDITGEGWQIDIASSSATVRAPGATIANIECFSGEFGGNDGLCKGKTESATTAHFSYPETITYGDNMTVAVQYEDAAAFDFPTELEKLIKQLQDNFQVLLLLLPGVGLAAWWWQKGRDKEFLSWNVFNHNTSDPQQTVPLVNMRHIPMVYEPIKELTPGEAGAIHDEKADNEDVIAEIIDLARQKYLKIERLESKKLFFIPDTDYVFTRLKHGDGTLPKQQQYLLTHLFNTGDKVKLSDLKGSFYTHMEGTKTRIMQSLKNKGLFFDDPKESRGLGMSIAIISLVIAGWWGIHLLTMGLFWAVPAFALSAIMALLAGYNLPAKTAPGSNFAWQVRGLKRSIQYGAWREKLKEKDLFFEEVLPFAIALGVVDKLVKDMKDLNVPEPQYLPVSNMGYWNTNTFVNSFSAQAASSLSYNPSSSSYSSGGGFSGGGSSGGGGGGGGGGSW
jgi:uncharacterized membrane protein YgcG